MTIDRNTAWAELHDPSTAAERLHAIAVEHPEFADAIVHHSNAYPELIEWVQSLGAAPAPLTVDDEVIDPATSAERLMEIAQDRPDLVDEIAAHPNSYPGLVEWMRLTVAPAEAAPAVDVAVVDVAAPQPEPAEVPLSDLAPEQIDLEDKITLAASAGAQALDEIGFAFAVMEMAGGVLDRLRSLVRPQDRILLAIPGILATANREDGVAFFLDDRLLIMPKAGGRHARLVRYADVTAGRVGTAPSELAEVLALYLQADETIIFAVPSDDLGQAGFLADLARGVPLAQLRPDLVDDEPVLAETPELAAARAELADAAIPGERVNALAAAHPELHVELAAHPRTYPDLLDWLESRPDPRIREAVAARRARDSGAAAPTTAVVAATPLPPAYATAQPTGPNQIRGTSGWEKADKALDTADKVTDVAFSIAAVIYGLFLIVAGIALAALLFGAGNGAGFFGILVAIYGVYVALPLPGFKLIIW